MEHNEQEKKEGDVIQEVQAKIEKQDNFLSKFNTKLVTLFVLGVLIGITLKTNALKTITMGFDDYKLVETKQDFDLSEKKSEEVQAAKEEESKAEQGVESENPESTEEVE